MGKQMSIGVHRRGSTVLVAGTDQIVVAREYIPWAVRWESSHPVMFVEVGDSWRVVNVYEVVRGSAPGVVFYGVEA